jgi:3-oxoadipate enol-lactonase
MRLLVLATVLGAAILFPVGGNGADAAPSQAIVVPQSGFVEVQGGRLYYETAGTGDPIVFIHGNMGDRRHWDHQFQALANQFRVIRYDVREYGLSSVVSEGVAYSDYHDVAALLDHLGVMSAHVVGWSMGSAIAIDFAMTYPERTKSLVSVGPWVSGYSSEAAKRDVFSLIAKIRAAFAGGGRPAAVRVLMDGFAGTIRVPAAGAEFARIATDHSFVSRGRRRSLNPAAVGRVSDIRVRTLILTAEHDVPACLEVADLLDRSIPDSTKIVMGGTGHMLHMERPEEFNKHLMNFLLRVGG